MMENTGVLSGNSSKNNKSIDSCVSILSTVGELFLLILNILWTLLEESYRFIIPKQKKSVKGEVVLITGAGRGIGRELALLYSAEGATVVCFDVLEDSNQETLKLISNLGYNKAYAYTCNVGDYTRVMELCKAVQRDVGNITILINNAGIGTTKHYCDMSRLEIENVINSNLMSQFWTVKAILPSMLKNNYGHIVSVSSLSSLMPFPFAIPYCASKYAVKGLMDALRRELATIKNCQVKTTVIHPYVTDTQIGMLENIKCSRLMPILKQKDVANTIINAQRKEISELTVPSYYYLFCSLARLLPTRVEQTIFNFFKVSLETRP